MYFCTYLETIKDNGDCGQVRTTGFYYDRQDAFDSVENNLLELDDYEYAIIENVSQGDLASSLSSEKQLFKYDKEKNIFEKCEMPENIKNYTFCMG